MESEKAKQMGRDACQIRACTEKIIEAMRIQKDRAEVRTIESWMGIIDNLAMLIFKMCDQFEHAAMDELKEEDQE